MAYGIPILSILLVLPAAQITSLGGFVDAIKTVFTVYGGQVTQNANGTVTADLTGLGSVFGGLVALGFIWALLSSGATWLMGADRAQAVAAAAMLVLGLIFYALGTQTRRRTAAPPPESERVPANT